MEFILGLFYEITQKWKYLLAPYFVVAFVISLLHFFPPVNTEKAGQHRLKIHFNFGNFRARLSFSFNLGSIVPLYGHAFPTQ